MKSIRDIYIRIMNFLNLWDERDLPPPQIINKNSDKIDFNEYIAYKDIFEQLVENYEQIEEDEAACHCFMEGYEEAMGMLEFLINTELEARFSTDIDKFHEELELFLKGESE